jgi:hypothetical protein
MTLHRLAVTVKLATPRGRPRRQRSQVTGPAFYDAVMSTWYVYEDFVTPAAVVHRGECPHCNHGQGLGRGRNEHENTWHGPFTSEADAHSAEIRSRSRMRDCRVCMA